jgi:hypothetical protein
MKPRDVSVSVHEANGELKVNVTFSIPGSIRRTEFPEGNIIPDEIDRRRIQKMIAKQLSKFELTEE